MADDYEHLPTWPREETRPLYRRRGWGGKDIYRRDEALQPRFRCRTRLGARIKLWRLLRAGR